MTADAPRHRSLLELLLPRGRATSALVLGSACPDRLRPAGPAAGDAPVDLVVVAPGEAERDGAWVDGAVDECGARLAAEGVAYLILPRRMRGRARRRLGARGLGVEAAFAHLPDVPVTRRLVPLERGAFSGVVPLSRWKRAAVSALFRLGAGAALRATAPGVALVARRPDAPGLVAWLALPDTPSGGARSAVVSSSWRPGGTSVVLHPLTEAGIAPVVAKVALDGTGSASHEAERLSRLGPAATRAGAAVPELVTTLELDGLSALVETRVGGEVAATRLTRRPALLDEMLAGVAGWLERWQADTARRHALSREHLEREVLAPAELLAPGMKGGPAYLAALRERCARLADAPVPLVAAHNDLTLWNVLVDARGGLGVVDWEAAEEEALPMKDFFYVAVDAVAATRGYRDRPAAARDCFGPDGGRALVVKRLQARIEAALGVEPDLAALTFHACWLGHAANEQRAARPSDDRPFLEIVEWLAATLRT